MPVDIFEGSSVAERTFSTDSVAVFGPPPQPTVNAVRNRQIGNKDKNRFMGIALLGKYKTKRGGGPFRRPLFYTIE